MRYNENSLSNYFILFPNHPPKDYDVGDEVKFVLLSDIISIWFVYTYFGKNRPVTIVSFYEKTTIQSRALPGPFHKLRVEC
uniref:Uncharacterized protein n=1 Tax=Megaselia scalaris TaxID=36166 RepID=T1GND9_MEGSC